MTVSIPLLSREEQEIREEDVHNELEELEILFGPSQPSKLNLSSFTLSLHSVYQHRFVRAVALVLIAFLILLGAKFWSPGFPFGLAGSPFFGLGDLSPYLHLPPFILDHLGGYSPYHPLDQYTVPFGCSLTQVNILHRHGSRYPTRSTGFGIRASVEKLANASLYHDPAYEFLNHYQYDLGYDELVTYGAVEARLSGRESFLRYGNPFFQNLPVPFIRTVDSQRVIDTARNWSFAYSAASGGRVFPDITIIPESNANNSLYAGCLNSRNHMPAKDWVNIFTPPIAARINQLVPDADLNNEDIVNILSMCAFDSVAKSSKSPFCSIFTAQDFRNYEYYHDLEFFYDRGYGNKMGPLQGVGYVNELLARLTNSPVNSTVFINHTLDDNPATFPLNRQVYVDFTHDRQMASIASTLGLFAEDEEKNDNSKLLDPNHPNPRRSWLVSEIIPFAGRYSIEKIDCQGTDNYVRITVNDKIKNIKGCENFYPGAGATRMLSQHEPGFGLCPLRRFLELQEYSIKDGDGDFEQCQQ